MKKTFPYKMIVCIFIIMVIVFVILKHTMTFWAVSQDFINIVKTIFLAVVICVFLFVIAFYFVKNRKK